MEDTGADQSGAGNGEHPSPNDAAGDSPAHRSEPASRADSYDCAGDGMRGADRNAKVRGAREGQRAGSFRRESAEGSELGDALSHSLDDAPAPGHGAAGHREVATNDHPIRDIKSFEQAAGRQRGGDDAHTFLRVVGAVAETVKSSGEQLQPAKPAVNLEGALIAYDPTGSNRHGDADDEAHDRREENEQHRFGPAAEDQRAEAGVGHGSAAITAHECVGRAGGKAEDKRNEVPEDG